MAEQADRVYKRLRITDPDDSQNYVDIPVLFEVTAAKCTAEQAQEYRFYFDNSENAKREVHIKTFYGSKESPIEVERIEEWTAKMQGQEHLFIMKDADADPPEHEQTHVVRFYQNNDSNSENYCDVQLIDRAKFKSMADQAQEWIYYLLHSDEAGTGYCDPSLPEM